MINTLGKARKLSAVVAMMGGLSILAATSQAHAYTQVDATGGPESVHFQGADSGYAVYLRVWVAGQMYTGQLSSPCAAQNAQTVETLKTWASLAQAALLSGKTLSIFYNDCMFNNVVNHYIAGMVLQR
jgi:hypothetical protein